jgi:hypothetical protein
MRVRRMGIPPVLRNRPMRNRPMRVRRMGIPPVLRNGSIITSV